MSTTQTAQTALEQFDDRYGYHTKGDGPVLFATEVLGATLDPWQERFLREFGNGARGISVAACHGPGKEQNVELVVPTPDGERRWGSLRPGDRLWAVDGTPTTITARYDHANRPNFRVTFSDGSSTEAGAEHLWGVEELYREARLARWRPRVLNTDTLRREGLYRQNGPGARRKKFRLPRHAPVRYAHRGLPVDPYLLGLWLGDGDTNGWITSIDPEIHAVVEALGGVWSPDRRTGHEKYVATVPGLTSCLPGLGLAGCRSWEKRVPREYREASIAQRRALLAGLMDTDGTVDNKRGSASFCTTSRVLMDDVLWIVRSLGGVARERAVKYPFYRDAEGQKVYGRPAYRCTILFEDSRDWLFRVERKRARLPSVIQARYLYRWITSIEPIGRADTMCVTVDHPRALYLTNDFIVTHNTAAASIAVVYALLFRFPLKAVATAPSRGQLEGALMKEVKKWVDKLPPALRTLLEVGSMSISLKAAPHRSSFEARTARPENPEALQGIHEDEGWVIILVDEASGVHERIYESAGGSMSGKNTQTILLSNPTRTSGFFFDTWHKPGLTEQWVRIRVSHEDSHRVTDQYVADMAARYGRDSNAFRVRVLGQFPRSDLDTIVAYDDVQAALVRDIEVPQHLRPVWGLDVAYYGDDLNALVGRNNIGVLPQILAWGGKDLMQTTGIVKREWDDTLPSFRPAEILIDVIGYGAGVYDRLGEQGLPVRGINVSETSAMLYPDRYRGYRTELWFLGSDWLRDKKHVLPQCPGTGLHRHGCISRELCWHDRLAAELTTVRYKMTSTGKMMAEPKDDMKKRGFKSPDVADAFMLTFAGEAITMIDGHNDWGARGWNQPISRDIPSLV